MLRLERISVAYGKHEALHEVSLDVPAGQTTVILGANGAGKTTLLNTIAGLVRPRPGGRILFEGIPIENEPPHRMVAAGIALVPEGRRLFGDMTVVENLRMGAYVHPGNEQRRLEKQLALFPRLAERRDQLARTMSGGEQQMLAIARALMSEPKLLLLDEPSLGLGPLLVKDLFATLRIITQRGQSVVLVEQNVRQSLRLADHVHVLENGRVVRSGRAAEIEGDAAIRQAYLGLAGRPAAAAGPAKVDAGPGKVNHPGGFVNPFARSVVDARDSTGHDKEPPMQRHADSPNVGAGFFHPFARSPSPKPAAPQEAAGDAPQTAPERAQEASVTGGFVNPQARSPQR